MLGGTLSTSAKALVACATAVGLLFGSVARGQVYFSSKVDYPSPESPYVVAIGDLNNDTHPDLVVQSEVTPSFVTYLGNGDGTFAAYASSFSPGYGWSFGIGNLNGDAWTDVVQPNEGGGIYLRFGEGTGVFDPPTWMDSPGPNPSYAVLGDFKEDGLLDIASSTYADVGNIAIHIGAGDGTFDAGTAFATSPGPRGLATADLNQDGHLDLVAAISGTSVDLNLVSVLLGVGDGTFSAKTDFTVNLTPYEVQIADFNGDAKLDIATAGNDGKVAILLGNGAGGFGTKTEFVAGEKCLSLAAADVDGDGAIDLLVPDAGNGFGRARLAVLKGLGDGTFEAPAYHGTLPAPMSVAVADLNHDGKPDAVTANRNPPDGTFDYGISVLLNCVPCATTAISVFLSQIRVTDGHVHATWLIPSRSSLFGVVQRRLDGGEWSALTTDAPIEGPEFSFNDASVTPGLRYAYRLSLRDHSDSWYTNEAWILVPAVEATPLRLSLRAPYPNPSRAGVTFRMGQSTSGVLRLRVFDVQGREVRRVDHDRDTPGWSTVYWDGTGSSRGPTPSGVYFALLTQGSETVTRKFVLSR